MDFEIVLACDSVGGIGMRSEDNSSTIPWKISDDMKFFASLTKNISGDPKDQDTSESKSENKLINVVIMGRKTADTFKKPLLGRVNVVISSNKNYRFNEGFHVFTSLDEAFASLKTNTHLLPTDFAINKVFVIGGAILCEEAIKHRRCRGVYLNNISYDYSCNIKLSKNFMDKLENKNGSFIKTDRSSSSLCKTLNKDVNITYTKYTYVNREELAYLDMLSRILEYGDYRETRNAKTYSVFGEKLEFDMDNGFPLLTTKQMFYRGIVEELLFFLRGDTNTKLLEDKKVMIWHDNTTKEFLKDNNKRHLEEYDMGPMYGYQWRNFGAPYQGCHYKYNKKQCLDEKECKETINLGIDQFSNAIDLIVKDPHSRRILMTTYNPAQAEEGVLYPCHGLIIQFYVEKDNRLSLQMYQRSIDSICGAGFNIASYALLLHIVTELVNNHKNRKHKIDYRPGRVIMIFGDTHIYSDEKADHVITAKEQLKRRNQTYPFCDLRFKKKIMTVDDLYTLEGTDIEFLNYISGKPLKVKMIA